MAITLKLSETMEVLWVILGIIIGIGVASVVVLLIGPNHIYGDDNENDLGLCINYHVQRSCDITDINKIYKEICDFAANPCGQIIAPQIQQTSTFTNQKIYNESNDKNVFPFTVEKGQLTFCYQLNKKVFGKRDTYVECNYVNMDQKKMQKVRDLLENFSRQ